MTRTILLLIGVLFMFLTYGCSQKEKQPIEYGITELHHYIDTIDDTSHRNELQQIVSKMEANLAEFYHASINIQTSIRELNRDYDAKREEIEAKFLLMDDARTAMQQKTVASYFELKAKCSPTQWQRIRTIYNESALKYFENQEL
jgi:hypothetical protein